LSFNRQSVHRAFPASLSNTLSYDLPLLFDVIDDHHNFAVALEFIHTVRAAGSFYFFLRVSIKIISSKPLCAFAKICLP